MALAKQMVSIPLRMGVDTKESPVLVDNARFLSLQEACFDRGSLGEIHKRNGNLIVPSFDTSGAAISSPQALACFNAELNLIAQSYLYGWSPTDNAWAKRGQLVPLGLLAENAIQKGAVSTSNPDGATLGNVSVYAWVEAGGVFAKVIDESNQAILAPRTQLTAVGMTLGNPKVVASGSTLYILCSSSTGALVAFTVGTATPTVIGTAATVIAAATLANNAAFDAVICNGYLCVGAINVLTYPSIWAINLPGLTIATGPTTVQSSAASLISVGTSGTNLAVTWLSGSTVVVAFYSVSAFALLNSYTVGTTIVANRLATVDQGGGAVMLVYDDGSIGTATVTNGTGKVWNGDQIYGLNLVSKPWLNGTSVYAMAVLPSTVQQTLFLLQFNAGGTGGFAIGKYFLWNAGPAPTNNRLPSAQINGARWSLAVTDQISLTSENGAAVVIDGVAELVLSTAQKPRSAQLGQNLLIATGSYLLNYDGAYLTEHGFNAYPEAPTLTFLTSQLAIIVDNQDPTGAQPQQVSIYVPDNGANPGGPVGQLITPGEYFCFNGFTENTGGSSPPAAQLFWFSVDGVGSAPSFAGYTKTQINVSSSLTAAEVALVIYENINSLIPGYTVTAPAAVSMTSGWVGQRIVCTATSTQYALAQPALNRVFSVTQMSQGNGATWKSSIGITCCPASLITGGQYFLFPIYTTGIAPYYCWFQVAGAGTDPSPYGGLYPSNVVKVVLSGTESADQVATAMQSAMATAFGTNATATANGPVVGIVTGGVGPGSNVPQSSWASNPTTGGVAQGYLGTNASGVISLLAMNYEATYQQIDAQGQLHQSDPSVPVTAYVPAYVTAPSGAGPFYPPAGTVVPPNAAIRVGVQNLTLTQKQGVYIEIWRTQSDPPAAAVQQVYQLVNAPEAIPNTPTSTSPTTYNDFLSDTALASNLPLYSNGGVIEHDPPPATGFVLNHQNRIWLQDAEDPQLWWYSEQFTNGQGVAFSESQTYRLNPGAGIIAAGPSVAAGSMDTTLVLFQQQMIWLLPGLGPDNTGNNGFFGPAQIVSSNVGCRDPDSVVLTPAGLVFKSTQGFYLLDRAYQLEKILDVDAFNADVVVAARCFENSTKVCFLSQSGTTWLYDLFYRSWCSWPSCSGIDAVVSPQGVFTFLRASDGAILEENPGSFEDGTSGFQMVATTAWLKFAGINGYQRVWKFFLQGTFNAGQTYRVQIAYDDDPTIVDNFTIAPAATSKFLRVDNSRQLCKSMQVTVSDVAPYQTNGTWALDAIDLELGIQRGGQKSVGISGSLG